MASDVPKRWMPPSPHSEKLVLELEAGRLTLRERGHGLPPVVVHEDGGHIDLPDIRWNGTTWMRVEGASSDGRQTAYSDVCGCSFEATELIISTSKSLSAEDVGRIRELEDDVEHMVRRMDRRLQKYSNFASSLRLIVKKMTELEHPDPENVQDYFREASELLQQGPLTKQTRMKLVDLTEKARLVAQAQEDAMKAEKTLALQAFLAFEELRGARNWDADFREIK